MHQRHSCAKSCSGCWPAPECLRLRCCSAPALSRMARRTKRQSGKRHGPMRERAALSAVRQPPIIQIRKHHDSRQTHSHRSGNSEETRRLRRLRLLVQSAMAIIAQGELPVEEAAELVMATRRVALEMFPGKEEAFDLIYRPRLQRLMQEVYRMQ